MRNKRINEYDNLIVLKNNQELSIESVIEDLWELKDGVLDLEHYHGDIYDNDEVHIISSVSDKLHYLFAVLHDDSKLIEELIPIFNGYLYDVIPSADRYAKGDNFKAWKEKLGFSIKDFLLNTKYVVISGNRYLEQVIDLGLFDWDNFEWTSWTDGDD